MKYFMVATGTDCATRYELPTVSSAVAQHNQLRRFVLVPIRTTTEFVGGYLTSAPGHRRRNNYNGFQTDQDLARGPSLLRRLH